MKSPCTKVCQIDQRTKLCLGCYRTLDEIATWGSMTSEGRERVMSDLDRRRLDREAS
ncbi:DUF1289 domain-containing protein [uncultured Roseibium sp.]|uniref:DUF1289 domain-containing protein n=1 Tax=uncultured Roseibium sp. TaxID=1936171 RepID=UPI0032179D18